MKRRRNIVDGLLMVCFFVFSMIMIVPVVIMVATSLKTMGDIYQKTYLFFPKVLHFENYIDAWNSADWMRILYNTFFITGTTVVVSLIINSIAGYAFSRLHFRFRDTLFFISLVGLMIPPQATLVPVFLILKNFPLVNGNNILGQGGTGFLNTYFGVMAPYLAGSFGVFLFRQFFLNFPQSLDDAAKIDGLSRMGAFVRIYVPLSKPVFVSLICLKAASTWNEYTWPLVITTTKEMYTAQVALVLFKSDTVILWNQLMASTCFIVLPLVVLFVFAQRAFVEGIVTTGMKG